MFRFIAAFSLVLFAAIAFAGSGNAPAVGGVNIPLTVPKAASTVCGALSANTLTQVDVTTTKMVNWKTFATADGSAVVVKRSFGAYSSNYFPGSDEKNLPLESGVTKLNLKPYGTAARYCVEKN